MLEGARPARTSPARVVDPSTHLHEFAGLSIDSEIYDHNATLPIVFGRLGLTGRLGNLERQLQSGLLRIRLPPLCFLSPANLLDDERG